MFKYFTAKFVGDGMSPEDKREALEELFVFGKENQQPFFRRMAVLTVVSTVIATGGLLSDSAAVVIGAMLIAPLRSKIGVEYHIDSLTMIFVGIINRSLKLLGI